MLPRSIRRTNRPYHAAHVAQLASFHATACHAIEANHYEVLGLEHTATAQEIKQQFYHLSQLHHPDHNPHDPTAPSRFHALSTAYTTLHNPDTRARYDRLHFPTATSTSRGSYSSSATRRASASSSTANGARPATGLSARRTPFHGPPPSFYRSGGWGQQAAKRRAAQSEHARPTETGQSTDRAGGGDRGGYGGGLGPGVLHPFGDASVPHFDHVSHFRTQEQQEARWQRRGRRRTRAGGDGTTASDGAESDGGREQGMEATGVGFILVMMVLLAGGMIPWGWSTGGRGPRREGSEPREGRDGP